MEIRYATLRDVAAVAAVEAACFPPAEAATEAQFAERIRHYGNHFWLMFDGEKLIAFVDGFVTDEPDLTDGMYETASMHDETGAWQMIFGVNTLPAYAVLSDFSNVALSTVSVLINSCGTMLSYLMY